MVRLYPRDCCKRTSQICVDMGHPRRQRRRRALVIRRPTQFVRNGGIDGRLIVVANGSVGKSLTATAEHLREAGRRQCVALTRFDRPPGDSPSR